MATNKLNIHDPNMFSDWLKNELHDNLSISPHIDRIPDDLRGVKGIYFWFMKESGYQELSKYIRVSSMEPLQARAIEGDVYHLVYIGTAGMGKNGGSDLLERLKWHIEDKHTNSAVCSGALSTLRQGLGALLSDDLIQISTEDTVNEFMKYFMRVFWVSYSENENLINDDEFSLIQHLKPLLNIRNNPNALSKASNNPTRLYKQRRIEIINSSRKRLNCSNELESKMSNSLPPSEINSRFKERVILLKENCIEFSVYQNESIADVVRGIPGLPTGKVTISMFDAMDMGLQIYPSWIRTGSGNQNIYTYFSNTGGPDRRFKLIRKYMIEHNIQEMIVRVCIDNNDSAASATSVVKSGSRPIKPPAAKAVNQEELSLSRNFKVVMMCSSNKQPGNLFYNGNAIKFYAIPNHANHEYLPDDHVPGMTMPWRDYVVANQNPATLPYMAYQLYTRQQYAGLFGQYGNNLYILSAGWGLVRADFRLPQYDITFSNAPGIPLNTIRNFGAPPRYKDFNQLNANNQDDIVFIGTPPYLDLFFALTANLPNRKIIYYKRAGISVENPAPNASFIYRYYHTNRNQNWHYDLADDLIAGIIP